MMPVMWAVVSFGMGVVLGALGMAVVNDRAMADISAERMAQAARRK